MPLVSVVMPVFNAQSTVEEAVASVLAQKNCQLELIVCDDGSTDGTARILSGLAGGGSPGRTIVVVTQNNGGPSAARNHALGYAQGKYIACIDADDLWLPGKLGAQVQALENNPDAAVAYGWTDIVDARNAFVHRDQRSTVSGDVYNNLLAGNFIVSGSNTLIRKSALLEVGKFDESLGAVEDWELHVRLAARYPFINIPQVVTRYRKSRDSLSSDIALMESSYLAAAQKVFAAAPAGCAPLMRKSNAAFYRYLAMRTLQCRAGPQRIVFMLRYVGKSLLNDPGSVLQVLRMLNPRGAIRLATH